MVPVVDLLVTDETEPALGDLPAARRWPSICRSCRTCRRCARRGARRRATRPTGSSPARWRACASVDLIALCALDAHGRRPALAALLDAIARELPALSDALSGQYLSHALVSRQLADGSRAVIYRVVHITEYATPSRSRRRTTCCTSRRATPTGRSAGARSSTVTPAPASQAERRRSLRQPHDLLRGPGAAPPADRRIAPRRRAVAAAAAAVERRPGVGERARSRAPAARRRRCWRRAR